MTKTMAANIATDEIKIFVFNSVHNKRRGRRTMQKPDFDSACSEHFRNPFGGAVRKNNILRRVLEDKFGMAVSVNSVKEEAASGAALFSAYSIGMIEYKDGFCDYIKYAQKENEK